MMAFPKLKRVQNKVMYGIAFILLLGFVSCSRPLPLTDWYYIYPQDDFGDGYYLICKLGGKNDPKIENITEVLWSDQMIIIERLHKEWYIIKAKSERLKCFNNE